MAKTNFPTTPLSFIEIVMRSDAETLRQALEARVKVDALLAEREEAYRKIAELENQVEQVVGTSGVFVFPAPPLPVAGFAKTGQPLPQVKKSEPAPAPAPKVEEPEPEPEPEPVATPHPAKGGKKNND
jgi:hypothetical protein